jgi:hypothetical protein
MFQHVIVYLENHQLYASILMSNKVLPTFIDVGLIPFVSNYDYDLRLPAINQMRAESSQNRYETHLLANSAICYGENLRAASARGPGIWLCDPPERAPDLLLDS